MASPEAFAANMQSKSFKAKLSRRPTSQHSLTPNVSRSCGRINTLEAAPAASWQRGLAARRGVEARLHCHLAIRKLGLFRARMQISCQASL